MKFFGASSVQTKFSLGVFDWHELTRVSLTMRWAQRAVLSSQHRDYSSRPIEQTTPKKRITIPQLLRKYRKKEKLSMITAYDYNQAFLVDKLV